MSLAFEQKEHNFQLAQTLRKPFVHVALETLKECLYGNRKSDIFRHYFTTLNAP